MTTGPLAIGIDIWGHTTKLGVVNASGKILAAHRIQSQLTQESIDGYLGALLDVTTSMLDGFRADVTAVGISLIGAVREEQGGTVCAVNGPGLQGINLRTLLGSSLGLPVVLTNDLTAHALAEYWFGVGLGTSRFLCLALGTGVGAGVVIDGNPVMFWGGTAGDAGRIILDPSSSARCDGGVRGSAEALCGVAGIERLALERYSRAIPCSELIQAARRGDDPLATGLFKEIGAHLGHLLAILSVLFFPSRIALSGGVAEAGPALLDPCVAQFESLVADYFEIVAASSRGYCTTVEIRKGLLGGDAAMIGAAARALRSSGAVVAP
jgi:glucokinase